MNLVIDIGNTRIKTALFDGSGISELVLFETMSELIAETSYINKANKAIIGSVVDGLESYYSQINELIPTLLFTPNTPIPIQNTYQSAATLGSDRLAAAIASYGLHPNTNVLTIDAGTCIKYNFTNAQNQYLGGAISSGISMRFKALHQFTSKLPLITFDEKSVDLIGNNTMQSIQSGVLNGAIAEMDGMIDAYKVNYSQFLVLLTGGNADFFAKRLKNSIFAHQNLVLKGLNDILNYNSDFA
jgi:type III pantothenate kinase